VPSPTGLHPNWMPKAPQAGRPLLQMCTSGVQLLGVQDENNKNASLMPSSLLSQL
jgi:hypothetical protein